MSRPDRIRIELPPAPRALAKNNQQRRGGLWPAFRATKDYRRSAFVLAKVALDGRRPPMWEQAEARAWFYWRDQRGMANDPVSLPFYLAPVFDGIEDAGIVTDDRVIYIHSTHMDVDREHPRVVVVISEVSEL